MPPEEAEDFQAIPIGHQRRPKMDKYEREVRRLEEMLDRLSIDDQLKLAQEYLEGMLGHLYWWERCMHRLAHAQVAGVLSKEQFDLFLKMNAEFRGTIQPFLDQLDGAADGE